MKLGIIIYANDRGTVRNALRFGNFALQKGDQVRVFLLGRGVECESLDTDRFKVTEQLQAFADSCGEIFTRGSCLKIHQSEGSEPCPTSTMEDMYHIIKESDKEVLWLK